MSDLTFATQSQPSTFSPQDKQKNSKFSVILVTIVVLALLAQMGYFFYSRYVSNTLNSPFQNLSNSATMNYEGDGTVVPRNDGPINNPSQISQVGPVYLDKGTRALGIIEKLPDEYLIKSEVKWTIQGKVVLVDKDSFNDGSEDFGAVISLINTKGDVLRLRMSQIEISKMKILKVHQGEIQGELALEDIKPGDMVDLTVSVDLFDMRSSADNILIEVRTY